MKIPQDGDFFVEDKKIYHQVKNVLKIAKAEKIIVCDGEGIEAECVIRDFDRDRLNLSVIETRENAGEPKRKVVLCLSILKKENFELAAQKAVEVGVSEITPIITERTVKLGLKTERLQKIIREASEQSGRSVLPKLNEPINFSEALASAMSNSHVFFFDSSGSSLNTYPIILNTGIAVFIGPEGGWMEKEIALAKDSGAKIVSLGSLTLRAETATVVATYLTTTLTL